MTRFVAVFVAVGVSIAGAGVAQAQAQSMPLPGGAVLKFEKLQVERNGKLEDARGGEEVRRLLNNAHCTCSQANPVTTETFGYLVTLTGSPTGLTRPVDVYVGTGCDDPAKIDLNCLKVTSIPRIEDIRLNETKIRIPLYQAVNVNMTGTCLTNISSATVWLMVDQDGNGNYDHWVTTVVPKPFEEASVTGIDTLAPSLPEGLQASGSEGSIEISWDQPTNTSDLFYFQALCTNLDDSAVEGVVVPEPKYQRVGDVCMTTTPIDVGETMGPREGIPVSSIPPPFAALDPDYLCGQSEMGARRLQIDNLKDGMPYKVALVAVDNYGNFTATYFTSTVKPQPVIDFWEDLQSRNSAIDGGCLLSKTYGDDSALTRTLRGFRDGTLARSALGRLLADAYYATLGELAVESLPARVAVGLALLPLVALALLWHLLGLPALLALLALPWLWRRLAARAARRRARRARLALAIAAAAAVLAPGVAAADDFTPYWEDPGQELDAPGEVKWHAGIRVGPYIPDIDLQFPLNATTGLGAYEAMFGTYYFGTSTGVERHERRVWQAMPMLDVDRIVWRGFGQIGVGGSFGYMQKTAYAYADGTTQDQAERLRSRSAKHTFRLVPLAATVTYRFTYLDERWGIPVVPYVRGGLSYYLWWMKGPNGDLSKVCEGGDAMMMCRDDKAYGGTAGVQVSAGIAIRAERIDPDAARSMRNSGIQHAGFYGEVFWGRVDGFGSETRLWVGDTTWFAGANFEF
jgi:hypothetical protein